MSIIYKYPVRMLVACSLVTVMIGCGQEERNVPARAESTASAEDPTVLFLGTSLTAGYGLPTDLAYPALLQEKIDSAGIPFQVVNAGLSGETSAGALRRLDWLLRQPFEVIVIETGANDMLRGTDLDVTMGNIQAIIDRVREERPDVEIVLAGMRAPPNLGNEYTREFREIYPDLADRNDLPLIPFLLQDVAGEPELNQADGIHPNAAGQEIVAENVWAVLKPVLERSAAATP
ncbi:MAG TPA: arylesterase [Longimicrobiaceae bacterium]|nr:arylesterase [Longimicrobiaceae bacterium]